MNQPSLPSMLLNEPAYQKKYTSQAASPNAKMMLSPATEKRPLRMTASVSPGGLIPSLSDNVAWRRALGLVFPTRADRMASLWLLRITGQMHDSGNGHCPEREHMGRHGRVVKRDTARHAHADALALAAFEFLAGDGARLARFFDMTGITIETILAAAQEPRFFAGVLDHVISDETLLLAFSSEREVDPNEIVAARDILMEDCWERDTT
jgi:hypothetical protein